MYSIHSTGVISKYLNVKQIGIYPYVNDKESFLKDIVEIENNTVVFYSALLDSKLSIRTPIGVDAAYHGMALQILDNEAEIYKTLNEFQYHGLYTE